MKSRKQKMTDAELLEYIRECSPANENGCWIWGKSKNSFGYGTIGRFGGSYLVHRIAFELSQKTSARGLCVCHTCDTPACCNPEHLFLGLPVDNVRDMQSKGRRTSYVGEKNNRAALTAKDILEIRDLCECKRMTYLEIANIYGSIKPAAIYKIKNRISWSHIA